MKYFQLIFPTDLDSVQLSPGPEVGPQGAGETGGSQGQEAPYAEDEGSLPLAGGADEDGLVGPHVRDVEGVPGSDLHVSVTVLLYELISKLVKRSPGLLVRGLHLFLEADPDNAETLAGEAVQGRPVGHIRPASHRELEAVLVGHNLLLPSQANQDYWKCNYRSQAGNRSQDLPCRQDGVSLLHLLRIQYCLSIVTFRQNRTEPVAPSL